MESPFQALHPDVARWCAERLGEPTPPQRDAVPLGLERRNLLICSPTGTGKTLAAFLPVISRLAELRDRDELFARTYALYVSPLRALGYDVEHNLRRPMREMGLLERPNTERARVRRGRIREKFVRTGVRTGDTPKEERRLMLSRPPHILVTTPESLAVMLGDGELPAQVCACWKRSSSTKCTRLPEISADRNSRFCLNRSNVFR